MSDSVILIPVSIGELLDKVSILRLKAERITSLEKLTAILTELEMLEALVPEGSEIWLCRLEEVNSKLWDIEDEIRSKERTQNFGPEFIRLARSVYFTNDERARLKQEVNTQFGSRLTEVKSYEAY